MISRCVFARLLGCHECFIGLYALIGSLSVSRYQRYAINTCFAQESIVEISDRVLCNHWRRDSINYIIEANGER